MPAGVDVAEVSYRFKPAPFSSHTLLFDHFPAPGQGRRVLDAGCAGGYIARELVARGYHVTGIDLVRLPDFPAEVDFIAADLDRGLPPLDRTFDLVLCADVLEHLRDPLRLLVDIRRYLAPGGRLIASLPNSGNAYFRANILLGRFPQHDKGLFDRTHVRFFTWDGWVDLLGRGGFHILEVQPSCVPVGIALARWEQSAWVRALERLSFEAARVWKRMFAYQFVVLAAAEAEA
jgi:SAM-dependent methyltransferase